jgi:hypothetical protein
VCLASRWPAKETSDKLDRYALSETPF